MANKEKKAKTPSQLKRKYKAIGFSCFLGQFASVAAPFVAIGIANYEEYFVEYNGTKMSIAAVLAAGLMGFAVWLVSKRKLENSYITLLIGWGVITAIFFLLGQIINDISYIMLFGLIGLVGAFGLDIASAKAYAKADEIQKGIDSAKEQMTKEAYIDEVKESQEKQVKIKIKK